MIHHSFGASRGAARIIWTLSAPLLAIMAGSLPNVASAGSAIALASDYNPGSSPSGNMNLVVAMSCIQMRLLPEEAINAATLNGAYAMSLGETLGSVTPGKRANLIITRPVPSLAYLPYAFGSNLIDRVMIGGELI